MWVYLMGKNKMIGLKLQKKVRKQLNFKGTSINDVSSKIGFLTPPPSPCRLVSALGKQPTKEMSAFSVPPSPLDPPMCNM